MRPVVLALAAAVGWGLWTFLTKLATRSLAPEAVLVVSYLVGGVFGLVFVLATVEGPVLASFADPVGLPFAVGAGVASGLGSVAYYVSLRTGDVSVVSPITAMYFAVAVVLGVVVLGESVTLSKVAGVACAVVAVVLLTG